MASASDIQRLFLQAVFSRRVLSKKLAQTLWAKCIEAVQGKINKCRGIRCLKKDLFVTAAANDKLDLPHPDNKTAWEDFLVKVNDSLDPLDLDFRHLHDESTGREMYALVNRKGDDIAQMATDYSAGEIAYFKAIVEQIMLAPNESYSLSSLAALREVNALKSNMSKTQAEIVLGSFVAKGWLLKSPRGRYSLSTRTLLELMPYLKSTYPDEVIECTICMEIITRGIACHTVNCKIRMHLHCYTNYRRIHPTCPACSKQWPQEANRPLVPVGEDAIKDGQDDLRRRVRRKSSVEDEQDADQDMEQDEPSQLTQSQLKPQTQRRKGKQTTMNIDNEEDDHSSAPKRSQRRSRK